MSTVARNPRTFAPQANTSTEDSVNYNQPRNSLVRAFNKGRTVVAGFLVRWWRKARRAASAVKMAVIRAAKAVARFAAPVARMLAAPFIRAAKAVQSGYRVITDSRLGYIAQATWARVSRAWREVIRPFLKGWGVFFGAVAWITSLAAAPLLTTVVTAAAGLVLLALSKGLTWLEGSDALLARVARRVLAGLDALLRVAFYVGAGLMVTLAASMSPAFAAIIVIELVLKSVGWRPFESFSSGIAAAFSGTRDRQAGPGSRAAERQLEDAEFDAKMERDRREADERYETAMAAARERFTAGVAADLAEFKAKFSSANPAYAKFRASLDDSADAIARVTVNAAASDAAVSAGNVTAGNVTAFRPVLVKLGKASSAHERDIVSRYNECRREGWSHEEALEGLTIRPDIAPNYPELWTRGNFLTAKGTEEMWGTEHDVPPATADEIGEVHDMTCAGCALLVTSLLPSKVLVTAAGQADLVCEECLAAEVAAAESAARAQRAAAATAARKAHGVDVRMTWSDVRASEEHALSRALFSGDLTTRQLDRLAELGWTGDDDTRVWLETAFYRDSRGVPHEREWTCLSNGQSVARIWYERKTKAWFSAEMPSSWPTSGAAKFAINRELINRELRNAGGTSAEPARAAQVD